MFSDVLKYLRKREHMTQQELANKLKISRGAVSMYELGQREP
ncbi:MAG: helix-turn-helix transcriptional regulator, partial [Oscillospiraceae bacterium]|nr:helix-turn-helix transcriptional regulator [Oscillospiraceae bacterium]